VRDNLAAVLDAAYWGLAISATILAVTTAAVTVIAGYWTTHCAIWTGRRMRHHWDLARMQSRPAPRQTATPQACDDYWTIRRAWHQPTREEARP
jgi:hypothetical protein